MVASENKWTLFQMHNLFQYHRTKKNFKSFLQTHIRLLTLLKALFLYILCVLTPHYNFLWTGFYTDNFSSQPGSKIITPLYIITIIKLVYKCL